MNQGLNEQLQTVQLLPGGGYVTVSANNGWSQQSVPAGGRPGSKPTTGPRAVAAPTNVSVPVHTLTPVGRQVAYMDTSTGNLVSQAGPHSQFSRSVTPQQQQQQPGRVGTVMQLQGFQHGPSAQQAQLQQQQQQQQQQQAMQQHQLMQQQQQQQVMQMQAGAAGPLMYKLTNGTRVVKAGQPYPNTTIVQTAVAMPAGAQQMGIVTARQPGMAGPPQQQQLQGMQPQPGGGQGGMGLAAQQAHQAKLAFMHQSQPQQHVLVAQPQQGMQQGVQQQQMQQMQMQQQMQQQMMQQQQQQGPKLQPGMGMSMGGGAPGRTVTPPGAFQSIAMRPAATAVRPTNVGGGGAITLQQVFAPPPSTITTTITSVRPAMRIPKLGTVATYNPVTGVRSATTNTAMPGGGVTPVLPAGLPASLVQQAQKVHLLQQQGSLLQAQLLGQVGGPTGALAIRPTLVAGSLNSGGGGGSQRQTTVVVGSNGLTVHAPGMSAMQSSQQQQQQQQALQQLQQQQQQGAGQQVVNITLADGTTTTTVLDGATLNRMLSESSRGQAAKMQLAQQQVRHPGSLQELNQMLHLRNVGGGLQQVQLSGTGLAPGQVLIRAGSQQHQQLLGLGMGGHGPQQPSPTAAGAAQMRGGVQVLGGGSSGNSGSLSFLQGAQQQHQGQGGRQDGTGANVFDSSAAYAQLPSMGAQQHHGHNQGHHQGQGQGQGQGPPERLRSQQNVDGLSVVDLDAMLDQQHHHAFSAAAAQQQHQHQQGMRPGSMNLSGLGSLQEPSSSGSLGHLSHDETLTGLGSGGLGSSGDGGGSMDAASALAALSAGGGMGALAGSSREDLQLILVSIGQELARHGISVETAVTSGWLGVLTGMDVAALADAHADEERRIMSPSLHPSSQAGVMQLQRAGSATHSGAQQQMSGPQQFQPHHSYSMSVGGGGGGGSDSVTSMSRPQSDMSLGLALGGAPLLPPGSNYGSSGVLNHHSAAGTQGSFSNGNSDTPLGDFGGNGNGSSSAERSATAAILALTSSTRTSLSVAPSEDGGSSAGGGGGGDGPLSAPAAKPVGVSSALGGMFERGSYGAFQYGLFGMGGLAGVGEHSLSADHDHTAMEYSEDAAALADVFGEKPWPPFGVSLMAEELGLNAQAVPPPGLGSGQAASAGGGTKLIDSASEYEARRRAAMAASKHAASADCQPQIASAAATVHGIAGAAAPPAPLKGMPTAPRALAVVMAVGEVGASAEVRGEGEAEVAAVSEAATAEAADQEMEKRFANLDLGCGFY